MAIVENEDGQLRAKKKNIYIYSKKSKKSLKNLIKLDVSVNDPSSVAVPYKYIYIYIYIFISVSEKTYL